jgi:sialate O-acetylesterase
VLAAALLSAGSALADVKLPPVLSSHMVLQRGTAVPVWGTAAPGEKVTVKFRTQEKAATAGADGKWAVALDPLTAGGPDALTVAGTNTVTLDDVLVGEVWVGSGQSNMAGGVAGYAKNDPVLANLAADSYPKVRLSKSGGNWAEATPQAISGFSAILFAFGVRLHKDLDVPVGLMVGAVGGTPSGHWLSEAAYKSDPGIQAAVKAAAATYDPAKAQAQHAKTLAAWETTAEAAKKDGKPAPRKPDAPVAPGEVRGKVGHLYEAHIRPMIPFAVRGVLWDQGESGTAAVGVDQFTLMNALEAGWRKDWGRPDLPFVIVQKPSGGGCAWDPADPITDKADKFAPLPPVVPPTSSGDSRLLHVRLMTLPHTFLATSSDLGPGVHPTNKSGYGERSARVALSGVYGKPVEYSGPVYQAHAVEGNKVRVTFTHVGAGLASKHGDKLQGFAVAGADGVYHWADAAIDGAAVVLSSEKVANPAAVRYADAATHPWANLFNKDGLPAVPFRTPLPSK